MYTVSSSVRQDTKEVIFRCRRSSDPSRAGVCQRRVALLVPIADGFGRGGEPERSCSGVWSERPRGVGAVVVTLPERWPRSRQAQRWRSGPTSLDRAHGPLPEQACPVHPNAWLSEGAWEGVSLRGHRDNSVTTNSLSTARG